MSLPSQYDHVQAQNRWYPFWEDRGYFHDQPDSRTPYSIVIPPPNVTGALHLGHALNNTLQDVLIRWKRMQGFNVLWMPGTDHAGIATQAVVERRLLEEENLSRHELGREKLIERIWDWKNAYESRILGQLKQMGCSCDWQRTRFTLDEVCTKAVRRTFFSLFTEQLIYRGKRLVNWDTFLQTAVSDDEVKHKTVQGSFWHFSYPVVDPRRGEPDRVTVATTRPETMLGDTAVAVHPDPAAALDKLEADLQDKLEAAPNKERSALRSQLEQLVQRRANRLPQLIQLREMALDGRHVMLPLLGREIPMVADPWAKPELGSGCVKITPAHDPNDYEVGIRCRLPMINILNPDGTLNENAGPYEGCRIDVARKRVVADMDEQGLLDEIEDREIEIAHSDRSKTPVEPLLADQWFVRMDRLAQTAMDAVADGRVQIFPPRYAKGYMDWLSEKRDWPIGRQLWWGHRIPIWSQTVATEDQAAQLFAKLEKDVAAGRVSYQVEQGAAEPANDSTAVARAPAVDASYGTLHVCIDRDDAELEARYESWGFRRDEDVLDTWFSSALWPHSTLGWPEEKPELDYYYPTSVLVTSRDIITLWVARMVLTGLHNMGEVPFREVYIHPKILDGYGETMSKSKGNGVDPADVVEKFGADALRFGLAYTTTETQDVRMPVKFECPHCQKLIEQTQKNRVLPRVKCVQCGQPFSTQWAEKEEDKALPRGAAVSERFELGRKFCNKLWNASRFALINLENHVSAPVAWEELAVEDRWILSRLATVTLEVTTALEKYQYADAARTLYDFAWNEFCDFYVEMVKTRLQEDECRPVAQRVLAHTLDTLLRLLHPMIPFLTEEVWQLLAHPAPERGMPSPESAAESIMIAPWPNFDQSFQDAKIEEQFASFQAVLGGINKVRSLQNIPPKTTVPFRVRCDEATVELLKPMEPYFESMARGKATHWGPDVEPPATSANVNLPVADVYVDMHEFIDVDAEIARMEKELDNLRGVIARKEEKLANDNFVSRAPAEIVQKERDDLDEYRRDLGKVEQALEKLHSQD